MGKLGTKDVKTGGGVPKTLQAGNTIASIQKIELDQPPYMQKDNGYFVVLHLEGPDLGEGFEGFFIDSKAKTGPRHKGQVGRVKTNRWPYKDGTTKSGIKVSRDMDIMKVIKNICIALDNEKWFDDQDEKHDTIEQLIEAFNADDVAKDKHLNFCICAREYMKQNTYTGLDLFLPKFSKVGVPFEELSASPSRLIKFDSEDEKHLERLSPAEDNGFEPSTDDDADGTVEGSATEEFTL